MKAYCEHDTKYRQVTKARRAPGCGQIDSEDRLEDLCTRIHSWPTPAFPSVQADPASQKQLRSYKTSAFEAGDKAHEL